MSFVAPDMTAATPELFLLSATCAVLVVDVYLPVRFRVLPRIESPEASRLITSRTAIEPTDRH